MFVIICENISLKIPFQCKNFFWSKRKIKIEMETVKWGREGETDYCLKLTELNQEEQAQFISDIKELLKTSKLVRFSENTACKKS